jgi:hypothetical protein
MNKESLSSSKPDGTRGAGWASPSAHSVKNGTPAEIDKKPEPEVLRFNWCDVVSKKTFCYDRRRRVRQIIAQFPKGVEVTIYGSHCKSKKDFEVSHLIHKSRDVFLEPFLPWECEYAWKSKSTFTPHCTPKWGSLVFFSGTWNVCPSSSQIFKGQIYRDALQRSGSGCWFPRDDEMIKATAFFRHLARCNLTAIRERIKLADLRNFDFLQGGLWDGLLPALMKGRFSEAEKAFKFALEIETARGLEEPFFVEDHFPFSITPYQKALLDLCKKREEEKKTNLPSVKELFNHMDGGFLGRDSIEIKNFRKNLWGVGLRWLIESHKK